MKHVFLFLSLFLLCVSLGKAQETIIKHTVEKGETVFQLSRTYNVTPEEIYALNPSAVDIIKIGEVLSIPKKDGQNQSSPSSNSIISNSSSNTITYAVVYGDTKYSLARRFGISIEEFERQNPHTRNGLQAGHILKIEGQRNASTSDHITIVKTHLVLKGQTLWGISHENGLTVEQLVNANSDILSGILQIGQVLKIPEPSSVNNSNAGTYLVQRGDTKYGLSKKYGVTIAELEAANPHIVRMLMAGHTIQIPNVSTITENETAEDTKPEEVEITSTEGTTELPNDSTITENETIEDTKPEEVETTSTEGTTELPNDSKIAENESIEETKPEGVEVTSTEETTDETKSEVSSAEAQVDEALEDVKPTETEIASETTSTIEEVGSEENTVEPDPTVTYKNYEIQPKETLYGLSKKAGMSISDFVTLNPQLANGVQMGTIVKMPSYTSNEEQPEIKTDLVVKKSNKRYVDLSQTIKTVKKNQILLFLPFSDSKYNSDYIRNINFNEVSNVFIKEHLEFYRGAKIAQDSAKALGLDFNIKIVETNSSNRNTKAATLAKENNIGMVDAVLLPFYENDIEEVATLVNDKNIPVLTTSTAILEHGLKNIYHSVPSLNSKRNIMLDYMKAKDANLIVVCDVFRKESRAYISNYAPNAKFIEVNKNGVFNSDEFLSQLDANKMNYVILESEKNSVFLSTTNLLLGQLSSYSIQLALLDKSLIPNTDDVSNKRFVILQMFYPSLTPLETPSFASNFEEAYKKTFSVEPSENVKFGFDLTFDTLLRTSQEKSFEASTETDVTEYTTLKFDYKAYKEGSHDNKGLYIIQYNSDGTLKELK